MYAPPSVYGVTPCTIVVMDLFVTEHVEITSSPPPPVPPCTGVDEVC